MKLAEALKTRADNQERINQLDSRLGMNAQVQEGEEPSEKPGELLKELNAVIAEQETLIARINLTNSKTVIDGKSLTELLSKRDCLRQKIRIMREFLSAASGGRNYRSTRSEIKILSTVNVAALRKDVDALEKEFRELDMKIQALNWSTELI